MATFVLPQDQSLEAFGDTGCESNWSIVILTINDKLFGDWDDDS